MMTAIFGRNRHIAIPPLSGVRVYTHGGTAAAANWWEVSGKTCVAAYQPKGAADLATSYSNLASPGTNDAAPGTAPTFDAATGWTFNGSTQYLTTGITPTATYTIIIRFSDVDTSLGSHRLFGESGTNAEMYLSPRSSANYRIYIWGSGWLIVPAVSSVSNGVMCLAGKNCYYNGSPDGASSGTFTGTPNAIDIGRVGTVYSSASVQASAIYSDTLTAGEVATVSTAMAAL